MIVTSQRTGLPARRHHNENAIKTLGTASAPAPDMHRKMYLGPFSLPATKPETQPLERPDLEPVKIGWRYWKLCNGLLHSVFVSYTWRPGGFERSSAKQYGSEHLGHRPLGDNLGYHAFRDKEQAEQDASWHGWYPAVVGSVAMWGEVIEHKHGWRSEYAAVRSLTEITGVSSFSSKHRLLQELREKYCCKVVTQL